MKHALAALLWCLAILLGTAGTASGAYVDATSENRVGVSGPNPDIRTYVLGSLELEPQRGDTILGYDPATGVVFYVNQNPWTAFDPLGLEKESIARRVVRCICQTVKGVTGDPRPVAGSSEERSSRLDTSWMDRSVASVHPQSVDSVEGVVDMAFTTAGVASLPLAMPRAPKATSPQPTGGVISGVVEETPGSSALITKVKTEAEVVATKTPEVGDKVTRHWGGNSGPDGQSWTREPAIAQTRENLGLGKSNTGEFVSEGTLVETTGVTSRRAKEWDGFSGGGDEVLVPDPQRQIKLESVRMPDKPLPDK